MERSGWIPRGIHIPPSIKQDAVLLPALFVFNCFQFSSWTDLGQVATKPWLLLVWLYGLLGLVPLAWRDRAPVVIFAIQCAHTVAGWPILHYYTPVVGVPVALYAVSVHRSGRTSLLALLASFIPNGLIVSVVFFWNYHHVYHDFSDAVRTSIANSVFLVLVAGGAWGAGRLTRASQQRVQLLERQQEQLERHQKHLESQQKTAQESVAEERRRIAREFHDIVTHSVTSIILQAAGATEVADIDPARVKQSLVNIETTGKQAMAELRRMLGVLVRSDPTDHAAGIGELGPQPGLEDLAALLATARNTGIPVTVCEEGIPRKLDPSLDLAAYRIAQEGLTNVLKHAGKDANPQLRLRWGTESLIIQIDNGTTLAEAPGGQGLSAGHGLVGLRERAHAVGGHLSAGAHGGVGYQLTATLPFAAPAVPPGVSSITGPCPCSEGPRNDL